MTDNPTRGKKKERKPKPFAEDRASAMEGDVFLSDLPPRVQQAIRDAFNDAGCLDLYGGRAVEYINVVAQQMRGNRERAVELAARIRNATAALNTLTVAEPLEDADADR